MNLQEFQRVESDLSEQSRRQRWSDMLAALGRFVAIGDVDLDDGTWTNFLQGLVELEDMDAFGTEGLRF